MSQQADVIRRIVALSETIMEGLEHTQQQLEEIRYEEALSLFRDTLDGVSSIHHAVEPMADALDMDKLIAAKEQLLILAYQYVSLHQDCRHEWLKAHVSKNLLPAFRNWQTELGRLLKPCILN